MKSASLVLSRFVNLDVFKSRNYQLVDIKAWFASQDYFFDSVTTPTTFVVSPRDAAGVQFALTSECNRLSMAAFETMAGIRKEETLSKSGAWGALRAYYSSYFAAHALLRMFGITFTHLEQPHIKKILEIHSIFSNSPNELRLTKGSYKIEWDRNLGNLSCIKMEDSHKGMWSCFLILINQLMADVSSEDILISTKLEALEILGRVKSGLCLNGCGNSGGWLSKFRNSLNYQHTQGIWFPYTEKNTAPIYVENMSRRWLNDSSTFRIVEKSSDIEKFFEASMLITALLRELILDCSGKVDGLSPVFSNGGIRLLKLLQAA
jgi:hypothetical protein